MGQDSTWEKLLQGLVLTGDPQTFPVAYEVGSRLGASPAFTSLWQGDTEMIGKLRAAFRGCELKPSARNVSYTRGTWVPAEGGATGNTAVTAEGVLLVALHRLVMRTTELRAVHAPHWPSDASAEATWRRALSGWAEAVDEVAASDGSMSIACGGMYGKRTRRGSSGADAARRVLSEAAEAAGATLAGVKGWLGAAIGGGGDQAAPAPRDRTADPNERAR